MQKKEKIADFEKKENLLSKFKHFLRHRHRKVIFVCIVAAILVFLTYLFIQTYFSSETCYLKSCFIDKIATCKKASFSYIEDYAVWSYTIKGARGDSCVIDVYVPEVQKVTSSAKALEGKEMTCFLPKGMAVMPDEKIEYCHGILKEAVQDQIIERMHLYIVQKIGQIEKELGVGNKTGNLTGTTNTTANITGTNATA